MNKHLLRLLYLAREKEVLAVTTATVHRFVNKIPCEEEHFYRPTAAEMHVMRELAEYPVNNEMPESEEGGDEGGLFNNKKMVNIFKKVEEFTM